MRRNALVASVLMFSAMSVWPAGLSQAWAGEGAAPTDAADGRQDQSYLNASPEDIARWRDLKFGLFIHWGPVSLKGTEISWSRAGERRGLPAGKGGIPVGVYDNLYKQFNPVKFDANQWVDIAKSAGMNYMVFTTRHHAGFSMFDSQFTDYKITSPDSSYRKDIVKQLADACHAGGLAWGTYYSQPDWHHPDYMTENHAKYLAYMHGQVKELLSNYGRVDMVFFDGLGGDARRYDAERLFRMMRALQPHVVINNRCGLPGDYDTPEQRIGKMQTGRPWETCMTIGRQWSWKPNDDIKPLKECLQTLVKVVCGDGNLLLNVGPMPSGQIEPRQVERLRAMGQWLTQYGQSIYHTRGGPFERGDWGGATCRGKTVYIHMLDPRKEGVVLPAVSGRVISSSVLTGGTVSVVQTEEGIKISVPTADRQSIDTIVVLNFDRAISNIKVLKPTLQSVPR
jgi:alpha-L-fucosidase